MEEQQGQQEANLIAHARLTEQQVQTALAEFLLKDEELKAAVADKKLRLVTQWQTHKWSDPDALVYVFFTEVPEEDSENASALIDENASALIDIDQDSGPDLGAPLGSPFFKEAE
jgi:hypothetical protein|tara:strand:- start:6787 stop:7131 length:345 start_codon:yes stop_codon:yes gene_type:complete